MSSKEYASVVQDAFPIIEAIRYGGILQLVVDCEDYDAFKALPAALKYDEVVCGKSGWNSDTCRGYYTSVHKPTYRV